MTAATARRLAWTLVLLAVALTVAGTILSVTDGNRTDPRDALTCAFMLAFTSAGHVIATRQWGNPIGWLFLAVGVAVGLARLAGSYADYWQQTGAGQRTLGEIAVVYGNLSWITFILVPATFLPLLFPDGRLLSRRWRPVAWCAVVGIAGGFAVLWMKPGHLEDEPDTVNPFGVESRVLDVVDPVTLAILMFGVLGSALSLILRFRKARGEQRQQMKWIALAGAIAGVTIFAVFMLSQAVEQVPGADISIMASVLALPAATAVAIVRYRLYDIDVVINRTLVYGSLTATLAGVYIGSVLLLQLALSDLTQGSGLAVAASTLAVAALFRPVRGRIQQIVDRRFFRSRYDAARTVDAFATRLRDEVDLVALSTDLQTVAAETMRPAHVSLWLRTPGART